MPNKILDDMRDLPESSNRRKPIIFLLLPVGLAIFVALMVLTSTSEFQPKHWIVVSTQFVLAFISVVRYFKT